MGRAITDKIISFGETEGSTEKSYSLIGYITDSKCKTLSEILNNIEGSCGLEAFWKAISKNDRTNIKDNLKRNRDRVEDETEDQHMLDEIHQIEKSMAFDKAMKVDAICTAISTLALGIGCFAVSVEYLAVGVTLPIFAMAGIAMAATLVAGLVAGVITYEVSKPSNELVEANTQRENRIKQ